jgi:hypothetical protein
VTWSPELSRFVAVANSGTGNRVMTWSIPKARNTINILGGKIGVNKNPEANFDINGVIRTNNLYTSSDQRIKTNILEYTPDINLLPNVYEYKYIKDDITTIGFIAQEIEKLYPNAIKTISDFVPDINKSVKINRNTFILENHNLQVNDKLKINDQEVVVKNIKDNTITIDTIFNTEYVYVYGKKVIDFKILDKNYLYKINVAITNNLIKRYRELKQ